jgi:hypothetical protein
MGYDSHFDLDLAHGEFGEGTLGALLKQFGSQIEVKRDRITSTTLNVAIETKCRGKASGINVTTAQWWAFVIDDKRSVPQQIIIVSTDRLKKACRAWNASHPKIVGGDREQGYPEGVSEMVLLPLTELVSYKF